jgi:hypothetical protein
VTRAGICGQQPEDGLFHRNLGRSHQPEKVKKNFGTVSLANCGSRKSCRKRTDLSGL